MGPRMVSVLLALNAAAWTASILSVFTHTQPVPLPVRITLMLLTASMVQWVILVVTATKSKKGP